jgi:hypothetical protein
MSALGEQAPDNAPAQFSLTARDAIGLNSWWLELAFRALGENRLDPDSIGVDGAMRDLLLKLTAEHRAFVSQMPISLFEVSTGLSIEGISDRQCTSEEATFATLYWATMRSYATSAPKSAALHFGLPLALSSRLAEASADAIRTMGLSGISGFTLSAKDAIETLVRSLVDKRSKVRPEIAWRSAQMAIIRTRGERR